MVDFTIIVATDAGGGIGIENRMPWHLPEDMAHFRTLTSGHPVIMGRKTFESIGRPLPKRRNIVVTRNPDWSHDGVEAVGSLEAAAALVGAAETATAFIIGGAQIYQQALEQGLVGRIISTEIAQSFACDAFFPLPDTSQWQETAREAHHSEQSGLDYAFVTKRRIA